MSKTSKQLYNECPFRYTRKVSTVVEGVIYTGYCAWCQFFNWELLQSDCAYCNVEVEKLGSCESELVDSNSGETKGERDDESD